jgi:hypothetical protein
VDEQEVRGPHHIFQRNRASAVGSADVKTAVVTGGILHAVNQFMNAFRLQDVVVVSHVALVVDFDDHILVTALEEPLRRLVGGVHNRRRVRQPLILAKIKVAQNDNHADFVGAIEDALQPAHRVGTKRTVRLQGRIVPGLITRITFR